MKFYKNEESLLINLLGKNTNLTEVVADTVEASFVLSKASSKAS